MNIIQKMKWEWFLLRMRLRMIPIEQGDKYMRKNYCRFGIHAIRSGYVGYGGSNQRMKHIRFLRCKHCNYIFFAKKGDKKRYEEHEQKTKVNISALVGHPSSSKLKQ